MVFLHFICMGNIIMGINLIYVRFNMVVNKDCMFGGKLSRIPVPPMRGHLQCRDTCLDGQMSLQDRFYSSNVYMDTAVYVRANKISYTFDQTDTHKSWC